MLYCLAGPSLGSEKSTPFQRRATIATCRPTGRDVTGRLAQSEFSLREKLNHRRLHVFNYANDVILTLLYFIFQMLEFDTPRLLNYIML